MYFNMMQVTRMPFRISLRTQVVTYLMTTFCGKNFCQIKHHKYLSITSVIGEFLISKMFWTAKLIFLKNPFFSYWKIDSYVCGLLQWLCQV